MPENYGFVNPFSICFTLLKMRYQAFDLNISERRFLTPNDEVNVFINYESIMSNLSLLKDLENKLILERNFPFILESETINLCAHYRRFFRDNKLKTNIYLYYTDLNSDNYKSFKYNDEYRSYYLNKFLMNPKYQLLGNSMVNKILPRVQKILEFIPDVHFIIGHNIEGSLIPRIIANKNPNIKNFIITGDVYDTQYQLLPQNFMVTYFRRSPISNTIFTDFNGFIRFYLKEVMDENMNPLIFQNPSFYSVLLSTAGNKKRSVESIKGIGPKSTYLKLEKGINDGLITNSTSSIELIKKAFNDGEIENEVEDNFHCTDIDFQINELSKDDIFDIESQIVSRTDFNSLIKLNQSDYREYPLMLPELTC